MVLDRWRATQQVLAMKQRPLLATAGAYYRLAKRRDTTPEQAQAYRKRADAFVRRDRELRARDRENFVDLLLGRGKSL